ncbi:MAG: TonB-dependent receptor [Opitutaceae bacterium]|nr:TonB-dependent receptor [Opitutaceae bacterium]
MNTSRILPLACLAVASTVLPFAGASADADVGEPVAIDLAEYEITGTRPAAIDSVAVKLPARVLETPRSLTVIDATRISVQDFQTADDVLNWVPGMNANAGSYHFFSRGFRMGPTDWKVDGFAGRVVGGSYSPNLFGYEQVVALKGPAGVLYGTSGSPGGQVSLVTKKPQAAPSVSVGVRARTYAGGESGFGEQSGLEFEVDATGPVPGVDDVRYRLLASVEDGYLDRPAFADHNEFYRLSFAWSIDDDRRFEIVPMVEWSQEDRAQRNSSISPSTSRTTTDGRTDYTLADASPRDVSLSAGSRVDDNFTTGFDLAARLSDAWSANAALRYHDRTYRLNSWSVQTATLRQADAADPRSWVVSRRHSRTGRDFEDLTLDVSTSYTIRSFQDIENTTQVGANFRRGDNTGYSTNTGANQSPINIYTGEAAAPLVADASPALVRGELARADEWNVYLQNRTTYRDRVIISLSGAWVGDRTDTVTRDSGVTPNLGLVYLLSDKISVYTSFSTSYQLPNATYEDVDGRTGQFDPTEGESYEVGVKAEFWRNVVAATVSLFDTQLNGVLVAQPADDDHPSGYYAQLDTGRRSRGAELEFTVAPLQSWSTTFTYAYIDAYDRSAAGARAGRAPMTPRHAATVFSRYTINDGWLRGWAVHAGVIWQDERVGGQSAPNATSNTDPLWLDSFCRVDAGLGRRFGEWSFALNIENLTDEDYLLGGSTGLNLERANPRALSLRVGRTW